MSKKETEWQKREAEWQKSEAEWQKREAALQQEVHQLKEACWLKMLLTFVVSLYIFLKLPCLVEFVYSVHLIFGLSAMIASCAVFTKSLMYVSALAFSLQYICCLSSLLL